MARVTFIHGIGNKNAPERLLASWRERVGAPLANVDVRMVYWADLVYAAPKPAKAATLLALDETREAATLLEDDATGDSSTEHRSAVGHEPEARSLRRRLEPGCAECGVLQTNLEAALESEGIEPIDRSWLDELSPDERDFVSALRGQLGERDATELFDVAPASPGGSAAQWALDLVARDAAHYLFDRRLPRAPEGLRTAVRERFVDAAQGAEGPHVIVGHSLGSVIAYDCLRYLDACPRIDALISIGTPLGLPIVQERLAPGWRKHDAYPSRLGGWVNLFDRYDLVAGGDPTLADDILHDGAPRVVDEAVQNRGPWRHAALAYLAQPRLADTLSAFLAGAP